MLAILCLILCNFDQMFFFDTLTETFKDTICDVAFDGGFGGGEQH